MTLSPLLAAPWAVQLHAFAALGALGVGAMQLAGRKGGARHRVLGWTWVALMLVVALTSFPISAKHPWILVLSVTVLAMLPAAVAAARRGEVQRHRWRMIALFCGALLVTGAFTLMPGRIMGRMVFGW
jgi:uncharacterized membrane protein